MLFNIHYARLIYDLTQIYWAPHMLAKLYRFSSLNVDKFSQMYHHQLISSLVIEDGVVQIYAQSPLYIRNPQGAIMPKNRLKAGKQIINLRFSANVEKFEEESDVITYMKLRSASMLNLG